MGADPHKLERFIVRFAINQHQIGPYMAIAVIFPVAGQRVVVVVSGERRIRRQ